MPRHTPNSYSAWVLWGSLTVLAGCGSQSAEPLPTASITAPKATSSNNPLQGLADPAALIANPPATPPPRQNLHPHVLVRTSQGDIKLQLDAAKAPETVDNFLENYVKRGFYDRTVFHYVEPDFVVAAGGFSADLQSPETRAPIRNEAHNGLKNLAGTVAMSRQPDFADSATAQFFINLTDNPELDADAEEEQSGYCVFGKVVEGMDVVQKISRCAVQDVGEFPNVPVQPVVIHSIQQLD